MHDVIVVGLGAMGAAAAWQLASRGARVLGIDQHSPPHALGSTHGRTRIIREAYFEHPLYVPLVRRAYELWRELEAARGEELLRETGGLMIGPEDGMLVAGALASARAHGIPHELLDASEVAARFPGFAVPPEMVALLEHRAGILFPERCVEAMLAAARRGGAEVLAGERVTAWRADAGGVSVTTTRGSHAAERLVLAAGPWLPGLAGGVSLPLQVERQMFHWFAPRARAEWFAAERCPIALVEFAPDRIFASFPDLGDGVKIGVHHGGELTDPDRVRREVSAAEDAAAAALLARFLPGAAGAIRDRRVCLYTNTPDTHFLIDAHPAWPRVLLVSPCSGHGFKFASAIGEVVADVVSGAGRPELEPFRLSRFTA